MEDKDITVDKVSINDNAAPAATDAQAAPATKDAQASAPQPAPTEAAQPANDDCQAQVNALIAELKELNDKYLRLAAELENTRRRSAIDAQSTARNRAMGVAKNFLPVMDAIDAALKHTPDDAGIIAMRGAMDVACAQTGIVKIESVGQVLNPQFHNAIQVIAADAPTGTIINELQPGYMFGDTVMRTAMVVVAK